MLVCINISLIFLISDMLVSMVNFTEIYRCSTEIVNVVQNELITNNLPTKPNFEILFLFSVFCVLSGQGKTWTRPLSFHWPIS